MTLTVLTDDQVRGLLENLTAEELEGFRNALASALHEYSAGNQDAGGSTAIHQPERISVHSTATGATTLFMPSCSSLGNSVKVITLSSAANQAPPTSTSTSPSPSPPAKPMIRPTGAVTLFSPSGSPIGFLHASALTAFRTALASLCLVQRRRLPPPHPHHQRATITLAAFGCGEQAYWHVRLALLARGRAVRRVCFVNRRASESARAVLRRFAGEEEEGGIAEEVRRREGWVGCRFELLTREGKGKEEYEGRVAVVLREADVVFCCTPSTEPLFDGGVLASEEGRRKERLVVAIGSYTPEMREIPREMIRQAIAGGEREAGVVVVDTIDGALKEAGELIEVGVRPEQLVELGQLVELKEAEPLRGSNTETSPAGQGARRDKVDLVPWLETGNVIYKSVGLGLMDLTVGMHLINYAKEKGVGSHIEGF
ncbi:hypothetical protein VTK56DRAFT_4871 [Thermocarpiscus australiensis]